MTAKAGSGFQLIFFLHIFQSQCIAMLIQNAATIYEGMKRKSLALIPSRSGIKFEKMIKPMDVSKNIDKRR
ncbi:MAG: hypothetical protein GTO20_22765 [Candidatus Aminicenantes bacterium]|nr:hypothetical protein [Candidatus Aminicenantes bacterium]